MYQRGVNNQSVWEREYHRELERLDIDPNEPPPERCPNCRSHLAETSGFVGETVLYCPNEQCERGVVWEDAAGAIARVF